MPRPMYLVATMLRRSASRLSNRPVLVSSVRAMATQARGGPSMPGVRGTADELDRQVTLKEDLAAHAGNYEESGITE